MIQAFLGSDDQADFVAMGCIYGLENQIHTQYYNAYTPNQILGLLEKIYFSVGNTSFDDFRGMQSSDIILVVLGVNNKVI
jgi:hypothetical protein